VVQLLHRQRSPEDLQHLIGWYKIRDVTLFFGENSTKQDIKKALELALVCEHANAVWLTKLFSGRNVNTKEEARQVFLGCENDPTAVCFAGTLARSFDEVHRAGDAGDAFAQALMAAEKSVAKGERDGFYWLGHCYQHGIGCEEDAERAKENYLVVAELGRLRALIYVGSLLGKDDPQRFVLYGRAAANGAANGESYAFLEEMYKQICSFNSGTGHAKVVFAIGRALKGHVDNEKRTSFGRGYPNFDTYIGPQIKLFIFSNFKCSRIEKQLTVGQL
jgi:hypothetical protein